MARRTQLYWFPLASTLALAGVALLLDLPARGVLAGGEHAGVWIVRVDTTSFVVWSGVALAALWTLQAATDRPRRPSPWSHHAYYVAFAILCTDAVFLAVNHGGGAPSVWLYALPVGAAWLGRFVAARFEDARAREEGEWDADGATRPSLSLRGSERALWVGTKRGWGYRTQLVGAPVATLALIVMQLSVRPGAGFWWDDALWIGFALSMLVYGFLTMSVSVTVGESAVTVAGGPFRIPLWTIPLEDLVEARAERVRPRQYGGWGYHAKGGRRCLIVRAGDALVLKRKAAADVVVTVDGAGEGAALVNALIARRAPDQVVAS
ncbi:MAG TPA: hypothetical protein VG318_13250 [Actinomycetota bacterium]|nr:hypothetical protein [Actinomycetota bacterium]